MSFSPDGSKLLIMTSRWSSNGWSSIGVLDLPTGKVKRISGIDAKYEMPSWSPDGTRIAFSGPCGTYIADADGSHASCIDPPLLNGAQPLGWIDDHRLLLTKGEHTAGLERDIYDLDLRSLSDAQYPPRSIVRFDPTASWALISARAEGESGERLAPATRLDLARIVDNSSSPESKLVFLVPRLSPTSLDSVAIIKSSSALSVGVPHTLRAIGWSRNRNQVIPRVIRWRSLTPEVASIDSLGIVVGHKEGQAIIELSAGGWRKAVDTLRFRSGRSEILLSEDWSAAANKHWLVFGVPAPQLMTEGGKNVLLNNGDDNFFSGVHSRQTFDATRGLALDLDMATPITKTQWQVILAGLQPLVDPSDLNHWDHKTGYITGFLGDRAGCWINYPVGEGPGNTTAATWYRSMRRAVGDSSFRIDTGSWYHVRLQMFPDGRCGKAIQGHAVEIGRSEGPISTPVLVVVQGMSVDTRIRVGGIRVTSGVPSDIDWTGLIYDGVSWQHR
jgi:hypothetical protein